MIARFLGLVAFLMAGSTLAAPPEQQGADLAELASKLFTIEKDTISVSGVSSGGAMAIQFGFAYPEQVTAIGVIAGPAFGCAENNLDKAIQKCMCCKSLDGAVIQPNISAMFGMTKALAGTPDGIGKLDQIARQKVWWFGGLFDGTVRSPSSSAIIELYKRIYQDVYGDTWQEYFVRNIHPNGISDLPSSEGELLAKNTAAHAHISPRDISDKEPKTRPCGEKGPPFMVKCNEFDPAKEILTTAYGSLDNKARAVADQVESGG